jgi:hypothetical protein
MLSKKEDKKKKEEEKEQKKRLKEEEKKRKDEEKRKAKETKEDEKKKKRQEKLLKKKSYSFHTSSSDPTVTSSLVSSAPLEVTTSGSTSYNDKSLYRSNSLPTLTPSNSQTMSKKEAYFSEIISNLRMTVEEDEENEMTAQDLETQLASMSKVFTRDRSGSLKGILRMDITEDLISFSRDTSPAPKKSPKNVRFEANSETPVVTEDTQHHEATQIMIADEDDTIRKINEVEFRKSLELLSEEQSMADLPEPDKDTQSTLCSDATVVEDSSYMVDTLKQEEILPEKLAEEISSNIAPTVNDNPISSESTSLEDSAISLEDDLTNESQTSSQIEVLDMTDNTTLQSPTVVIEQMDTDAPIAVCTDTNYTEEATVTEMGNKIDEMDYKGDSNMSPDTTIPEIATDIQNPGIESDHTNNNALPEILDVTPKGNQEHISISILEDSNPPTMPSTNTNTNDQLNSAHAIFNPPLSASQLVQLRQNFTNYIDQTRINGNP